MINTSMPKLKIGSIEARVPIIQGGMGVGISLSGLAAAVANQGGIGVISSVGIGMLEPDFHSDLKSANTRALLKEIRTARANTDGVLGINIMAAISDFDETVKTSIEAGIDIVIIGAGMPLKIPEGMTLEYLKSVKSKIVPVVSSARAANLIFKSWAKRYNHIPDALIVEGPLAGGHLGYKLDQISDPEFKLEKTLVEVVKVADTFQQKFGNEIPVIAAGGVYTGEDIYNLFKLGASGVQMGTRFAATTECDASDEFKQAIINCTKDDLRIIKSPVGLPGRAISNSFLADVDAGVKKPFKCPWKCLRTCDFVNAPYCIGQALTNAKLGKLDDGFVFAGQNAHRVNKIVSVQELFESLIKEYEETLASNSGVVPEAI